MQNKDILQFWEWFEQHSDNLQSANCDNDLMEELDKTISDWGFGWEIGPGLLKENSFTVSPNGNKELLDKTKDIIDEAPQMGHWEFYSTKQSKENWHTAILPEINFEIDASNWTYVLLRYDDNKLELLLKADSLSELDSETKDCAVDLILTNLLGEELKINKIDFLDIVDEFETGKGVTELKYLPSHLSTFSRRGL